MMSPTIYPHAIWAETQEAKIEVLDQVITLFFSDDFEKIPLPPASPALFLLRHKSGSPTLNAVLLARPPEADLTRSRHVLENDYHAVGLNDAEVTSIQQTDLPTGTEAVEAEIRFRRGTQAQTSKTLALRYRQHQILFTCLYAPEEAETAEKLWAQLKAELKAPPSDLQNPTRSQKHRQATAPWLLIAIVVLTILAAGLLRYQRSR